MGDDNRGGGKKGRNVGYGVMEGGNQKEEARRSGGGGLEVDTRRMINEM